MNSLNINNITLSEMKPVVDLIFYDNYVVNTKTHTFVSYGETYELNDYTNPEPIFRVPTQIGTYIPDDSINDIKIIRTQLAFGLAQFEGEYIILIYKNSTWGGIHNINL